MGMGGGQRGAPCAVRAARGGFRRPPGGASAYVTQALRGAHAHRCEQGQRRAPHSMVPHQPWIQREQQPMRRHELMLQPRVPACLLIARQAIAKLHPINDRPGDLARPLWRRGATEGGGGQQRREGRRNGVVIGRDQRVLRVLPTVPRLRRRGRGGRRVCREGWGRGKGPTVRRSLGALWEMRPSGLPGRQAGHEHGRVSSGEVPRGGHSRGQRLQPGQQCAVSQKALRKGSGARPAVAHLRCHLSEINGHGGQCGADHGQRGLCAPAVLAEGLVGHCTLVCSAWPGGRAGHPQPGGGGP
eukprot:RCo048622